MNEESTALPQKPETIGFPAPLLGKDNMRLDVLLHTNDRLVLNKPPYVLCGPDPERRETPVLCDALNLQTEAGKPELLRMGLDPRRPAQPIFHVEEEIAGIAVMAFGEKAATQARNQFGSYKWGIRFQFVAVGGPSQDEVVCELPVARHFRLAKSLISTSTGKKTRTEFTRLENFGRYSLWEARTNYYRRDQIYVHAQELGLRISGDKRYTREPPIYMSRLKRGWEGDREQERPIYEAPAIWLESLTFEDGTQIHAEPPPRLANLLKQIRRFARR